jgi:hypothetical protein
MTNDWRDSIAGARMQVDQQFQSRIQQSQFTSQEWGLIMTAIEFDIERPDDPDRAQLVADTSQLDQILPELDRIQQEMGGTGGTGPGSSPGGIVEQFKDLLSPSSNSSNGGGDREAAATALAEEYARDLQTYLEKRGRWEDIRTAASRQR